MSGAVLEAEVRVAARTNMFIAAMMLFDGRSTPVKVRNLSAAGALIETAVAPAAGVSFTLRRGSHAVRGSVAWTKENRCGLRFDSSVVVRDWMGPPANPGQVEVDAMFARARSGGGLCLAPGSLSRPEPRSPIQCEKLTQVSALIEALGDELAADAETVSRHGAALQKIDQALQLLEAVRRETR